jgi:hypothetical protein
MQDLNFVLGLKQYNPVTLMPEFLQSSGIIPQNWEIEGPPLLTDRRILVKFNNGVTIEGQPGTIAFSQPLESDPVIAKLVAKYALTLPKLIYLGVKTNIRRFVNFEYHTDGVSRYLAEKIFRRGAWQNFGMAPMVAQIDLVYALPDCQFCLTIDEAQMTVRGKEVPAVLFRGSFDYDIADDAVVRRLQKLNQAIQNCNRDISKFQAAIDDRFLAGVAREPQLVLPMFVLSSR